MKFKDFVQDDVRTRLVHTPLGTTNKDFYEKVARRDMPYIVETSVGFGLSKMHLKRVFDYIKSWLIRYNIKHEAINPYLTVAMVEGHYKRDKLIKALKRVREKHVFEPEGVYILREGDTDYIIIDYLYNKDFVKNLDECILDFSLAKKDNSCYVKLFSIKAESFPLELFDQMIYSLPELPDVRAGSVGLLVKRK